MQKTRIAAADAIAVKIATANVAIAAVNAIAAANNFRNRKAIYEAKTEKHKPKFNIG